MVEEVKERCSLFLDEDPRGPLCCLCTNASLERTSEEDMRGQGNRRLLTIVASVVDVVSSSQLG